MSDALAVLGGGPAAAAAALALARGGASVTLFRPARPGEKPCGGAVPAALVRELDSSLLAAVPSVEVRRAVVTSSFGARVELGTAGLRVFRRADLDAALVERAARAGVEIVDRKATGLESEAAVVGVRCGDLLRSFSWVIGADGARGLSRRTVGERHASESWGLGGSLEGVVGEAIVLGFPGVADAYCWIFPRPGGVSVGIAYEGGRLSHPSAAAQLTRFLEEFLDGGGAALAGAKRYRYPIPHYSSSTRAAVERGLARRILLVGDAAGVADPLTREGIRHAVVSGRCAAEALLAGEPTSYPVRLAACFEAEMERAHRAAALFFDADLAQAMVPVAWAHPGVRAVLGDLLACRQPYHGLRRRLLHAAIGAVTR